MATPITNLATVPHATAVALPWTFDIGTGERVSGTVNTTPGAGPQGHTGFNRWTVEAAKTAGTSGPIYREFSAALSGATGAARTVSIWVRFSSAVSAAISAVLRTSAPTTLINYCKNPGFEDGTSNHWNAPTFGNGVGNGAVSIAQAQSGLRSFLCSFTTIATSGNWTISTTTAATIRVVSGNQVTLSTYVRPSVTVTVTPAADFYIVATTTFVSTVTGTPVSCPANTWTRLSVTATTPATATGARLSLSALAATFGATGTIYVDSTQFEFGATATAFFDSFTQDDGGVDYSMTPEGWSQKVSATTLTTQATSGSTAVAANTWTRLSVPITSTGAFVGFEAQVLVAAASILPVAGWYDTTDAMIQSGLVVTPFFSPLYDEIAYWTGVENASTSILYLPVITATPDSPNARVDIDVIDGPPSQLLYVIRRDAQGSVLVRETSTGIAQYDGAGVISNIYDYEARQGFSTNYILTSADGIAVANTTIMIPKWGTWIKNPGKPFMNVKCLWNEDSEYVRKTRRDLIYVRGAKFPVAHTDRRVAPSGMIRLATETTSQAKALTSLLDDGAVVMIDVDPDFGVPVRYVSVGDVTGSRAGASDRGLTWEARLWTMQIDETSAPIGLPAGQTLTYESIPAAFDSYISLAASVLTYDDLAAGVW